jgi:hypothetical protein
LFLRPRGKISRESCFARPGRVKKRRFKHAHAGKDLRQTLLFSCPKSPADGVHLFADPVDESFKALDRMQIDPFGEIEVLRAWLLRFAQSPAQIGPLRAQEAGKALGIGAFAG